MEIAAKSGWNPGIARSVTQAAEATVEAATVSGLERVAESWSNAQAQWDGLVATMETRSFSDDVDYGDGDWQLEGDEYRMDSDDPDELEYDDPFLNLFSQTLPNVISIPGAAMIGLFVG